MFIIKYIYLQIQNQNHIFKIVTWVFSELSDPRDNTCTEMYVFVRKCMFFDTEVYVFDSRKIKEH